MEIDINRLVKEYGNMISMIAHRMILNKEIAREAAQEVWYELCKSITSFKGDSEISTWIYTIARRTIGRYAACEKQVKMSEIEYFRSLPEFEYSAKEESCLDVVFLQGIKNKVRFVILPCSVDCKRDALVAPRNAVNGQLLHQPRKHFKFILFNTAARCRTRQIKVRLRFASGRTIGFGAAVPAGKDRKCNCGNNDKQHRRRPDEGFF